MKIALYANGRNRAGEFLKRIIGSLVLKKQTKIFTTIDGLSRKLRRPMHGVAIAVLLPANREELSKIYSMQDLFTGTRIILILPDRRSDTVMLGFKLFPRFISYADGNFRDVAAVLKKMLENGHLSKDNHNKPNHITMNATGRFLNPIV